MLGLSLISSATSLLPPDQESSVLLMAQVVLWPVTLITSTKSFLSHTINIFTVMGISWAVILPTAIHIKVSIH